MTIAISDYLAESVTIPARLLLDLYWSLETLAEEREDDRDQRTMAAAREALLVQAPYNHALLVRMDVP